MFNILILCTSETTVANSTTYSGYDAAIYSAATMYVAQQNKGTGARYV